MKSVNKKIKEFITITFAAIIINPSLVKSHSIKDESYKNEMIELSLKIVVSNNCAAHKNGFLSLDNTLGMNKQILFLHRNLYKGTEEEIDKSQYNIIKENLEKYPKCFDISDVSK